MGKWRTIKCPVCKVQAEIPARAKAAFCGGNRDVGHHDPIDLFAESEKQDEELGGFG
jgi:hypothetical protein